MTPANARVLLREYGGGQQPCAGAAFLQHVDSQLRQSGVRHGSSHPSWRAYDARVLFSGYLPNYAYDLGATDNSVSFEKLRDSPKSMTGRRWPTPIPTSRREFEMGSPHLVDDAETSEGPRASQFG